MLFMLFMMKMLDFADKSALRLSTTVNHVRGIKIFRRNL